ncbi:lipopolysaccharide biosynthesis protein [Novosphingobium sp. TH158]|uniref:lipopolysaccharide biosynthesis protein n=1 Tax=Novosphingobium sp. TH158 TaxID=2067455 RepID=UPI000C7D194F|nr:lipopolysaccharide biosynthesis protein [Novosphingobium sp. TH158]PLK27673.1 polysaccharide biosynthesis protein [Novosphingobium sp. TH158]
MSEAANQDIAALAKGGRTNVFGFLLRLAARIPFLFIAGRLYSADDGGAALGRFASALVAVEFAALICTLGQKRGLAQRLSEEPQNPANIVADGLLMSAIIALPLVALLYAFPVLMFPSGIYHEPDLLLPLTVIPIAFTDIVLAALAYRFDIGTTVRSRSVVEPWVLSLASAALYFVVPKGGLSLAYIASIAAALLTALLPLYRAYGLPHEWKPHPLRLGRVALASVPLAIADAVEWGSRRLDLAILGAFVSPSAVGVYWAAQQIASLPQKFKTSFEPILGPVITRSIRENDMAAIARQVCQVGFWITAAQLGVALALGIPGEGVMGLIGPEFVGGTGALALLLLAEVVAATAVVSEAALIYLARMRNLMISVATIVLQIGFSVGGILLVKDMGLNDKYAAAAVAGGLMLSLACASIAKSLVLSRILGESVNNWRLSLAWAAIPAMAVGAAAVLFLPEWLAMIAGIPLILGVYLWIVWHKCFGPEDRVLFRKNVGS